LSFGLKIMAELESSPVATTRSAARLKTSGEDDMTWELDHVFLAVPDLGGSEQLLSEFGMTFTERRGHRGQGTTNACAMFENAFFELVGPYDVTELQSELVKPLGLKERIDWRETGACPFGLCFRPGRGALEVAALPFHTWPYAPPYVPPQGSIPIVTARGRWREPLVFLQGPRASFWPKDTQHRGAARVLTKVSVTLPLPAEPISQGVRWFAERQSFELKSGASYQLELEWDGGREQQSALVGDLPLLVRW
jgi:hypothetical protein